MRRGYFSTREHYLSCLIKLHGLTKEWSRFSSARFSRENRISTRFFSALKDLGILESKRNGKFYNHKWIGDAPTEDMASLVAEKVKELNPREAETLNTHFNNEFVSIEIKYISLFWGLYSYKKEIRKL